MTGAIDMDKILTGTSAAERTARAQLAQELTALLLSAQPPRHCLLNHSALRGEFQRLAAAAVCPKTHASAAKAHHCTPTCAFLPPAHDFKGVAAPLHTCAQMLLRLS